MKRAFDILLSGAGLVGSSPLWLLFASAIKLEDGGPVFFTQERIGLKGTTFDALKFRSMRPDAEAGVGAVQAVENDPRVTRVGRFMRATAMDELPQLWNIFRGDMSFVGPRALRPGEVETTGAALVHIEDIPGALIRGAAWVTLWDNLQAARVTAPRLLDAAIRALPRETDEQNAQRVLSYATRVFWRFMPPEARAARGPAFEAALRAGLDRGRTQSEKAAWFNAYRDVVLSTDGVAWLTRVWKRDEQVPGLRLAEPDEIANLFAFLASDEGANLNGAILSTDSGITAG